MKPPLWEFGGSGPVIHIAPANGFPPATYLPLFEGLKRDHRIVCVPPRALRGEPPPAQAGSWASVAEDLIEGWTAHDLAPLIATNEDGINRARGALVRAARVHVLDDGRLFLPGLHLKGMVA